MRFVKSIVILSVVIVCLLGATEAQTRRRKPPVKSSAVATPAPTPSPSPAEVIVDTAPKKNERPATTTAAKNTDGQTVGDPPYFYQFIQPNFEISKIVIGHDEAGKGTITFTRRMFNETETDPLQVSPAAMDRIRAAYTALNFMDSSENYQYEKNYSHLGTMTFSLKRGTKKRIAVFNYTTNNDARLLADEYRKLSNQFIWVFEITVARENQPLESPRLLDSLDGLIRRNEISDPEQMLPLLKGLSNDERIPLIARNHAGKLADKIQKKKP